MDAELLDQKIAELEEEIREYEARLNSASTDERTEELLLQAIISTSGSLNRLLDQKADLVKDAKTLHLTVKLCIGNNVHDCLVTFSSLKRPLDTVKEEVGMQKLLESGMSLDPFRLVTCMNGMVSSYASIEGQPFLIFHIPEKIVPLSGNEWSNVQLDQLKVVFEDVDLNVFFSNAELPHFDMSQRGADLMTRLDGIDESLFRKYDPKQQNGGNQHDNAEAICRNPLLMQPICKALFAARKYEGNEASFADDFVRHLLNEMGFNEGSLYAAPQMRTNLLYGDTVKTVSVDFAVIDLRSSARIGVIVDKKWGEEVPQKTSNSTAQLVAEGIAIAQRSEVTAGRKRDAFGNSVGGGDTSVANGGETVYGIRVTGSMFHFYALHVSSQILHSLEARVAAATPTTMYRYKSDSGLNFMVREDRAEIIHVLSLLQQVATRTGRDFAAPTF